MSQSELKEKVSQVPEAWENASDKGTTDFSSTSNWLRCWGDLTAPS